MSFFESKLRPSAQQMPITIPSKTLLLMLYLLLLFRPASKYKKVNGAEYCWVHGSRPNAFSSLEPENARGWRPWTLVWAVICWWPGSWANKWVSQACVWWQQQRCHVAPRGHLGLAWRLPVLREASEMNRELGASRGSTGILEFPQQTWMIA